MKKETYEALTPIEQIVLMNNISTMLANVQHELKDFDISNKIILLEAQDDNITFKANPSQIELLFDNPAPDITLTAPGNLYENIYVNFTETEG